MVCDIINDQFEVIQQKQIYACGGGDTRAICKANTDDSLNSRNKIPKHAVAKQVVMPSQIQFLDFHVFPQTILSVKMDI